MTTCIDAFKNIHIINSEQTLKVGLCCVSKSVPVDKIDFQNNAFLKQARDQWQESTWPKECIPCKYQEAKESTSRRHGSNQWFKDHNLDNHTVELVRMDYWTGDLCNLACAICGPANSSVWKQELNLPIETKKTVVNQFWKDLDLTSLRSIHFTGGEPLLSKEHVELLKAIPNKSVVHISYNTNGTVCASQDLLDLWSEFQLVELSFSIDDIGKRFEYQRYPAKWTDVTNNLQWYLDTAPHNTMFAVNTSVGILNQSNLESLKLWLQNNFSVSKFNDPIEHRSQPVKGNFASTANIKFVQPLLDQIDARRKTNWRRIFPELC
jgi:uncharacterized radical SAM superfamily Fe-S cluster-containing enzyme